MAAEAVRTFPGPWVATPLRRRPLDAPLAQGALPRRLAPAAPGARVLRAAAREA